MYVNEIYEMNNINKSKFDPFKLILLPFSIILLLRFIELNMFFFCTQNNEKQKTKQNAKLQAM